MGTSTQGYYFDELEVGMEDSYTRTVEAADIQGFADVSGDTNPVHLDEAYAKTTRFGGCIAHGMLTGSYVSTVIGTKLPGPGCIYVSQTHNFKAPVMIGDTVTARAKVTKLVERRNFVELETSCWVGDTLVISGSALIMVPSRPSHT